MVLATVSTQIGFCCLLFKLYSSIATFCGSILHVKSPHSTLAFRYVYPSIHPYTYICTAWLLIWEPQRICTFRASVPWQQWHEPKKGNGQQKDYPVPCFKRKLTKMRKSPSDSAFFWINNCVFDRSKVPFEAVYQVALQASYISISFQAWLGMYVPIFDKGCYMRHAHFTVWSAPAINVQNNSLADFPELNLLRVFVPWLSK